MQLETIMPRAAGVHGAVTAIMAGDLAEEIKEIIKPGSGTPTTPRPPSYDAPAVPQHEAPPQSDPGDEDDPREVGVPAMPSTPETDADPQNPNVRPDNPDAAGQSNAPAPDA